MWQHVSRYNLITCTNPLHGYHQVPIDPPTNWIEPDFLYRAAKYVQKSFDLFDEKTLIKVSAPSAFKMLIKSLKELYDGDSDQWALKDASNVEEI